jgi:hypothetical protein
MRIALLFEYKEDGKIGASGPGDVLRLVHAIRVQRWEPEVLVTTVDPTKLVNLFSAATQQRLIEIDSTCFIAGDVIESHLQALLKREFGQRLQNADVRHAFIGLEKHYPWSGTDQSEQSSHPFRRQRIDRSVNMNRARWSPPSTFACRKPTIAVAVRKLKTDRIRNTPDWFRSLIREVAQERKLGILWYGNVSFDLIDGEHAFDGSSLPFHVQINFLHANACCAAGWNSGGLDLASAAGLPTLRIGEFQAQGALCDEDTKTRRTYCWGGDFNSFLTSATNVGLAPRRLAASDFNQNVVKQSLEALMTHYRLMNLPRHVILPVDVALSVNTKEFLAQIDSFKVI